MESTDINKRLTPSTTQAPTQTPRKHKKPKVLSSEARLAKRECDRHWGKTYAEALTHRFSEMRAVMETIMSIMKCGNTSYL